MSRFVKRYITYFKTTCITRYMLYLCLLAMLYHIISYHIMSYHVMSCHVMSYRIMSCHVMSYRIIQYIIYIIPSNLTPYQVKAFIFLPSCVRSSHIVDFVSPNFLSCHKRLCWLKNVNHTAIEVFGSVFCFLLSITFVFQMSCASHAM